MRSLGGSNKKWGVGAALILLGAGTGALLGVSQTRSGAQQAIFRAVELADQEGSDQLDPNTVRILIETSPSGATIWLDGNKLADRTPLMIERPRSQAEHKIKMAKKGFRTVSSSFSIQSKAGMTLISHKLERSAKRASDLQKRPAPKPENAALLAIQTEPEVGVRIDDRDSGPTNHGPFALEPGRRHKITLVDEEDMPKREFWVELEKRERRHLVLDLRDNPE
jgi:hypothetical protein